MSSIKKIQERYEKRLAGKKRKPKNQIYYITPATPKDISDWADIRSANGRRISPMKKKSKQF